MSEDSSSDSDSNSEDDKLLADVPDSPRSPSGNRRNNLDAGSSSASDFFHRLVRDTSGLTGSMRGSFRSSTTSIDTVHLRKLNEKDRTAVPTCEIEMLSFVHDLCDCFKKTSHLREALMSSWARFRINYRCPDVKGNSLLHVAAMLGENKLVSAMAHLNPDMDQKNNNGDTALHLSTEYDHPSVITALLKHHASQRVPNNLEFIPVQIAAIKGHRQCLEVLLKYEDNTTVLTDHGETLLHLACRGLWSKFQQLRDGLTEELNQMSFSDNSKGDSNVCNELEAIRNVNEQSVRRDGFPVLELLLDAFRKHPDLLEIEDKIKTSPGMVLHYFACFNYYEGSKTILRTPFCVDANTLNKNGLTALWIASWFNNTRIGSLLLNFGADPNVPDPIRNVTPLHGAIYGYHIDRIEESCNFIDDLLAHGADPKQSDVSGETPAHLVVGTLDFRVMSMFIDYLGPESLAMKDDSGNTLFHYAVGCLDDISIYKLIDKGANLMSKNESEKVNDQGQSQTDVQEESKTLDRSRSIIIHRLPLQEAMKNGNSKNYFNALRRLDFEIISAKWNTSEYEEFLCAHLIAATRDVRPDIVRVIFQQISDVRKLHRILLFCDKNHEDETFTKTALEWAVENEDRLCVTEILHQEYAYHRSSKVSGLSCLRRQLTGDELLIWTIETFTMFYERTLAQRTILPFMGLLPLFISFSTFVYDYYSDIELTLQYYANSDFVIQNVTNAVINDTDCQDIIRTPSDYQTAFVANLGFLCLPLIILFAMCALEMYPEVKEFDLKMSEKLPKILLIILRIHLYPMWLILAFVFAPFFILFVAGRQVYFKFRHRRATKKNVFRRQLQKSEYFWGIARTAEAGLESCGQLILQVWLLSFDFKSLSDDSFWTLVDKSYNGIIHFLTFSYKPANDNEKSLGKIVMSLTALVFGVAACYRTLKRGAIKMSNTFFVYISLFLQVFARIFSLGLFFFTVRNFYPIMPMLLLSHFVVVFVIKWTFERARHIKGLMSWLVSFVNVFASSLVFVRIVPIEKKKSHPDPDYKQKIIQQHSTFFVQTLFFILVLIENIFLASAPLYYPSDNRASSCLSPETVKSYIGIVFGLCVGSWIFQIMYYKYMGHPWSAINGPTITRDDFSFFFHCCGKERLFKWSWNGSPGSNQEFGVHRLCWSKSCQLSCRHQEEFEYEDDILSS